MKSRAPSCPLSAASVIDLYFLEHRAKLLDLAAFLDRVERGSAATDAAADFRLKALRKAIGALIDGQPQRAERILTILSDPTDEPIATAGMKGARGAYQSEARSPRATPSTRAVSRHAGRRARR